MVKPNTDNPIYKIISQWLPETKPTGLRWIMILAALPFLVGGLWSFIEKGDFNNLVFGIGIFLAAFFGSSLALRSNSTFDRLKQRQNDIVPDRVLAAIADSTEIPTHIKEQFALLMHEKGVLRIRDIVDAYEELEAARITSGSREMTGFHKLMSHAKVEKCSESTK